MQISAYITEKELYQFRSNDHIKEYMAMKSVIAGSDMEAPAPHPLVMPELYRCASAG
jgi:hypothetical protein